MQICLLYNKENMYTLLCSITFWRHIYLSPLGTPFTSLDIQDVQLHISAESIFIKTDKDIPSSILVTSHDSASRTNCNHVTTARTLKYFMQMDYR